VVLKTRVTNAQNLKVGAAVQLKGIKIGSISDISFETLDTIIISFGVAESYLPYLKTDGHLAIKTQGMLGDKFLEILGGSETAPAVKENGFLVTEETSGLDKILTKGEDMLVVTNRVLGRIDLLLGDIEKNSVSGMMSDMRQAARESKEMVQEIRKANMGQAVKNAAAAARQLELTSTSLADIAGKVQHGPGTLHSLIYDKGLYEDLVSLMDGSKRSKVLKYFIRETIKSSEK
jgi:phospholipid/cholesterol/gamma-HCH transport system substrate-binding protein